MSRKVNKLLMFEKFSNGVLILLKIVDIIAIIYELITLIIMWLLSKSVIDRSTESFIAIGILVILTVITSIHRKVRLYKMLSGKTSYIYSINDMTNETILWLIKMVNVVIIAIFSYMLIKIGGAAILFITIPIEVLRIISMIGWYTLLGE